MKTNKNEWGFGLVGAFIMVILLIIVTGTGWFVWYTGHKKQATSTVQSPPISQSAPKATVTNYEECIKAGGEVVPQFDRCFINDKAFDKTQTAPSIVKFSDVDLGLQQAIKTTQQEYAPACKPDTTLVTHYDPNTAALVGVGCPGAIFLFGKDSSGWREVEHTQMGFNCVTLRKYKVPTAWLEQGSAPARCFEGSNFVTYE